MVFSIKAPCKTFNSKFWQLIRGCVTCTVFLRAVGVCSYLMFLHAEHCTSCLDMMKYVVYSILFGNVASFLIANFKLWQLKCHIFSGTLSCNEDSWFSLKLMMGVFLQAFYYLRQKGCGEDWYLTSWENPMYDRYMCIPLLMLLSR